MSLDIKPIKTRKSEIKQRFVMEKGFIPHFPSVGIIAGPAGSGKTTIMGNLLTEEKYYGPSWEGMRLQDEKGDWIEGIERRPYFDLVILLMGSTDDMYDQLHEDGVIGVKIYNPKPEDVAHIIKTQEDLIRQHDGDILKAPKLLVIADDILGNERLMRSEPFRILSTKNRHLNCSIFYLAQYIKMVPKKIREQASHVMCLRPTRECGEILCELYRELLMSKEQFMDILFRATNNPTKQDKNFLYIDKSAEPAKRYRRNFTTYLHLDGDEPVPIEFTAAEVKKKYKQVKKAHQKQVAKFPVEGIPNQDVVSKMHMPSDMHEFKAERKVYIVAGQRVYA